MKHSELIDIIKVSYETIPYHNLWYALKKGFLKNNLGGICTDKNYNLYKTLESLGYLVSLHSAKINGENTHQLVLLEFENQSYLIDVGLGWPIMKPIPVFENSRFRAYGVEYESEIKGNFLHLFRLKENKKTLVYITSIYKYNQDTIMNEFKFSYDDSLNYPFRNGIRFSKMVNNEFYFLHGNILYFSEDGILYEKHIRTWELFDELFKELFLFDVKIAREVAVKFKMFN